MAKRYCRTKCLIGLACGLAFAMPAFAQSVVPAVQPAPQAAPTGPDESTNVQAPSAQPTEPTVELFGIRIGLAAAVPPSYQATSFNTLAGQPMNSVDQVMSQQFTGRP